MDSDDCRPILAEEVLRLLHVGPLTDVCALCACKTSLLKIDNTNYVHLNDEYSDSRLTLMQLVKEIQFDEYMNETSPHLICEACVNSMCSFLIYKNKCRKITDGLNTLTQMVQNDLLEKVINVVTGETAKVLPHKNIHEYSEIDARKSTECAEIIRYEALKETYRSSEDDVREIITSEGGNYVCALCPSLVLTAEETATHKLLHYYKNVTRNLVLRNAYCVCCLNDDSVVDVGDTFVMEKSEMMSLKYIMGDVFANMDLQSVGNVQLCGKCFDKVLALYSFKKMFEASSTVVQDCVRSLESCLQSPKSAITVTEEKESQSICLLDVYSLFLNLSRNRTKTIAPFLKTMRVNDEDNVEQTPKSGREPSRHWTNRVNEYMCTICGIASKTLSQARYHRLDHCVPQKADRRVTRNDEPTIACHICGEEFVRPFDLHAHTTAKHKDLTFCPYCDKFYKITRKVILGSHMEACKKLAKPYNCDLCSAAFLNNVKLSSHRVRHFPRDVKCGFCKKKFWTLREFKNHQYKIHRDLLGIQFECSMCAMDFDTKTDRIKHAATHPPDTRHICRFCPATFRLKTNYIAHKCVGKIMHLRNHDKQVKRLRAKHDGINSDSEPDCERIGLDCMCDQCGKLFKTDRYLKAHRRKHELENKNPNNGASEPLVRSLITCEECDYKTISKNCFEAHVNRAHRKVKPYSCDDCERKFYTKLSLSLHCKTHAEVKPQRCYMCGNQFSSKKALRMHIRLHTGEKPYGCDLCEEKFITASRRQDHRIRKHFEPTVPCNECMKYFYTQREYRMHVKNYHLGERKRKLKLKKQALEEAKLIRNEQ